MASEVGICNLALGHLGDGANITSISPPDGSAQSQWCSQFYPVVRDALLEMHAWGFASKRGSLAYVTPTTNAWKYAYAAPNGVVNYLAIQDPNAPDDNTVGLQMAGMVPDFLGAGVSVYVPQPFVVSTTDEGDDVILTNQQDAVLRYTCIVTDPTKFSPLFVAALGRLLASYLAGPLLKGTVGRDESKAQLGMFERFMEKATESDANQRKLKMAPSAPWMVNR
jgi:hypothetical protein